jgi:hypothetical protein
VARNLGKSRLKVEVPPVAEEDSPAGEAARRIIAKSAFVTTHHFNLPEDRDWLGVILGARYDGSSVIVADGAPPTDSLETYQPSDIPGGRAPHLWLDAGRGSGSSLYDHIGPGFTLIRFTGADTAGLEAAARGRGVPLKVADVALPAARTLYDCDLYVLRPDGYIAWRGHAVPEDAGALLDTLRDGRP